MNQVLSFLNDYKEYIILGVVVIGGYVAYGKSKVKKFVIDELGKLEKDVVDTVKSNPVGFVSAVYSKLPASLKSVTTINSITKIVSKFLDK